MTLLLIIVAILCVNILSVKSLNVKIGRGGGAR
jgi:hypothetical protein